jgi:RND family efflux transporter MFP subunit
MKKYMWIFVVVLIAGGLLAVRMRRMQQKASAPLVRQVVPVVETTPVRSGVVGRVRHVTGTVIAGDEAQVAPRIMARLTEVRVREGDVVREGQVLALLDGRELEDAVAQAGAGLGAAGEAVSAAEATWEAQRDATRRDGTLHEAKAISDEQWESSQAAERMTQARLEAARAELEVVRKRHDQARTRRGYAILKAPFDGKITARLADAGDLAVPGKPILAVARDGGFRIRANLPVDDLSILAVGDGVTVSHGGSMVEAVVSRIVPATGASGLAVFEADLSEVPDTFLPGVTVGVDVDLHQGQGLVVPVDALLEGKNGSWVFVVDRDETIRPVRVQVFTRSVDSVVVEGDLEEGDALVVARPSRLMVLADGMSVVAKAREQEVVE